MPCGVSRAGGSDSDAQSIAAAPALALASAYVLDEAVRRREDVRLVQDDPPAELLVVLGVEDGGHPGVLAGVRDAAARLGGLRAGHGGHAAPWPRYS